MGPLFFGLTVKDFPSARHLDTLTINMRLHITAILVLTATTVLYCEPETFESSRVAHDTAVQVESPDSPQPSGELSELRDAALSDDYAYRQVAHLSDNIGPRGIGSLQAAAAVQYVAGELRKLGLEVRLEEVKVPHWLRGAETAELVEYPGQAPGATQKIVLTALGGNTPTPAEGITGDVVVVNGYKQLSQLGRQKVAGKIVLFNVIYDKQKAVSNYTPEAYGEVAQYRQEGAQHAA